MNYNTLYDCYNILWPPENKSLSFTLHETFLLMWNSKACWRSLSLAPIWQIEDCVMSIRFLVYITSSHGSPESSLLCDHLHADVSSGCLNFIISHWGPRIATRVSLFSCWWWGQQSCSETTLPHPALACIAGSRIPTDAGWKRTCIRWGLWSDVWKSGFLKNNISQNG